MKAALIRSPGAIDNISIEHIEPPNVGQDDVLIDVYCAALNHLDLWLVEGEMPGLELDSPMTLGADGAGIVAETGKHVDRVSVGERVVINAGLSCGDCEHCRKGEQSQCDSFRLLGEHVDGTYAEQVAVPAENVAPLPTGFSFEEGAAFPLVFLTAWRMLVTRAGIQAGDSVLIHGIGGGVSGAALQIASNMGGKILVTSSSRSKLDQAEDLGAHHGIHYPSESISDRVKEITKGRGVDLVVENVGAETWETSQKCVRKGGRIVTCGATTGPAPRTNINRIFWKQISILGSTMGSHGDFDQLVEWMHTSGTRPIIDQTYPLEDIHDAERRLQKGNQFGKIVLEIQESDE